jgi:hypothetical protein
MLVKFKEQFKFSPNGLDVVVYEADGEPCDISETAFEIADSLGIVETVKGEVKKELPKTDAKVEMPEIKPEAKTDDKKEVKKDNKKKK